MHCQVCLCKSRCQGPASTHGKAILNLIVGFGKLFTMWGYLLSSWSRLLDRHHYQIEEKGAGWGEGRG